MTSQKEDFRFDIFSACPGRQNVSFGPNRTIEETGIYQKPSQKMSIE